ncbi:MAG: hypothetical protein AAFX56_00295 [Pseudomonadota bacterium]
MLSAQSGYISACNPFLDGCASISATGRQIPGALAFRAVQLPYAVVLAAVWLLSVAWLKSINAISGNTARWVLICGLVGAVALVVYVTFLGTKTPLYAFMRRFGIYFYFLGTALAQVIVAIRVRAASPALGLRRLGGVLLVFAGLPFLLGIVNLAFKAVLHDPDATENRIEWLAALSMQTYFVCLYLAWRRTDFMLDARSGTRPG